LLYELVCGSPPFDADTLLGAGLDEMRRVLRESDPPKPSTRVTVLDPAGRTALSGRLGTPAERVSRLLAGEVDWIVLKAIEKDRGRRYQSPTELADDIEAYLAGHGVTAGPPGGWYRARKYFRRHRVAALLTGTVVLGLAGTLAATAVGLSREAAARQVAQANERRATAGEAASNEQRLRAERAARVAGSVLNIVGFIMQGSDPRSPGGRRDVTVGEMVDRFAPIVEEGKFVEGPPLDPEVVVHLRMMLANLYLGLGRYPDGRRQAEEALKLAESMYPADAPELVTPLLNVVGASWLTRYDLPGSEVKARRAIAALARKGEVNSPQHRRAMTLLSFMLHAQRKVPEALANDLERVRLLESAGPAMKANLASALLDVGLNSAALGRADDALRFSRRGQELAIEANGPDTFAVSRSYAIVAHALAMAGRFEEAEASARKGLELSVRFLGDGHPYPKFERGTLAFMLIQRGQLDEAEALLAKNQRVIAQNFGGGDESTTDHVSLAMIWRRKGDQAKALELFRRAEAAAFGGPTPAVERDSVDIADPSAEACGIYCDLGRAPEGAAMLRPVYDRIRARLARSGDDRPDNWNLRRMASELLRAYDLIGDEPSRAAAAELCDRYPGLEPAPGFPRRP
jgi:tetratricopeptide (TPR) repeat protein